MARIDRVLLVASYVLLCAVVVFLSWDLDRRLAQNREAICDAIWVSASVSVLGAGTDPEVLAEAEQLDTALRQVCGPPPGTLP